MTVEGGCDGMGVTEGVETVGMSADWLVKSAGSACRLMSLSVAWRW